MKNIPFLIVAIFGFFGCSRELTTHTLNEGKLTKVLTFEGDSSKHRLVKEEIFGEGDTKLSVLNFKNGELNSASLIYWQNGKIKEVINYASGKKDGPYQYYDAKGHLLIEGQMKNGQKNGLWITWYDETQKEEERTYKADNLEGKYTYWYIDGSLKKEEYYENGLKTKETVYQ